MALIMKNLGPADELMRKVFLALLKDSPEFLVLDQARTVHVQNIALLDEQLSKELSVTCQDVSDGTKIYLHLPYAANSVAWALISHPNKQGA